MEILIALKFLLVVGILYSDVAQAENSKKLPVSREFLVILGNVNVVSYPGTESDEFDYQPIQAKCTKNGGPAAFDTAVQALADLEKRYNSVIELWATKSVALYFHPNSVEEKENTIEYVRGFIQNSKDWMSHDHIDAVKSCLDPEERRGVDVIVNISNPVFEYILENNASRLTEFFASGAFECINLQEFDACFYDDPTSSQSTEAIFNLTSDEPDLSKFAVDLRTCTTFETTKKCVIEVFDGCSLKRPSNFARSVLDIAMAHSGCEAILEAHSAQATNQL